jgi:hypothetical protein
MKSKFVIGALLILSAVSTGAKADSFAAPVQCLVSAQKGNSGAKQEIVSAINFGELEVTLTTLESINSTLVKVDHHYKFQAVLIANDTYEMRMINQNSQTVTSAKVQVPNGLSQEQEIEVIGLRPGAAFPSYSIKAKCTLQSQAHSGIPNVTPGPPKVGGKPD